MRDLENKSSRFRPGEIIKLGPFRLVPSERLLDRGGNAIAIGSRRLDILIALVEKAGEVIPQRELIERAWPNLVVEKANLRIHIAGLRKVLGDGVDGARYITNVPGRGYCFVGPTQRITMEPAAPARSAPTHRSRTPKIFPAPLARMVGVENAIAMTADLLLEKRFVSIVGAGGLGKTTVAIALAHALFEEFDGKVFFVDLGGLTEAALVAATVASALGVSVQTPDPVDSMLAFAPGKRILLIMDNCEHVIDAVASLTERMFTDAPDTHLLTTSRQSLRAQGEYVYPLNALKSPPPSLELTAAQALTYPSVQLFMERAAAGGYRQELSDAEAPVVASICRRLDGIALAIELAAGHVAAWGIPVIQELLNKDVRLRRRGRSTTPPRHRTLNSMLDWSYGLLPDRDKRMLARLSVFVGNFTFDAAHAVAGDANMDTQHVTAALASLIEKSLVCVAPIGETTYLRLLETTHTFASGKLAEYPDADAVAMRHASWYGRWLRASVAGKPSFVTKDMPESVLHIGNVRAALEWCFSGQGDRAAGAELAAYAAHLLLNMCQMDECRRWCEQGLAALDDAQRGTRTELALQEAAAISTMLTTGNCDAVRIAIEHGLILGEMLGEVQRRLRLMAGLNIFLTRTGDFREALAVAERCATIAREAGVSGSCAISHWMLGCSYHLTGNQEAAGRHLDSGFKRAAEENLAQADVFGYDHRIRASITRARVLWLTGYPEQALRIARREIEEAEKNYHPVNSCVAMIGGAQVLMWCGHSEEAHRRTAHLIAHAERHSLGICRTVGRALKGELAIAQGDPEAGMALLNETMQTFSAGRHFLHATNIHRALAEGLLKTGRTADALVKIDHALARAQAQGDSCDMPELLRVRATILLAAGADETADTAGTDHTAAAEQVLASAIDRARRQSALGLELRAAITLAKVWQRQGRHGEARRILTGLHERFTEGHDTADLKTAAAMIEQLQQRQPL